MASPVDIITYIGIPLAVLGILPTFYTILTSYLTLRTIRRILYHNHVPAITRSSLLSGIVEIEIQRKSIQPLDREDDEYFRSNPQGMRSSLRGGSWTVFNWKEMVIGMKSYRLQYHDELAQPQAEIDFERLVAYLLDRGAVPSVAGFNDLRNSGLWTPAGTKLLLSPTTNDGALMVAPSDDSDGILSLCLEWRKEWNLRDYDSLPPYWIRVTPKLKEFPPAEEDSKSEIKEMEHDEESVPAYTPTPTPTPTPKSPGAPIRLRIGAAGVEEAHREDCPSEVLRLNHVHSPPHTNTTPPTALWFAIAATAFGAPTGGLWAFAIPANISRMSSLETVPCGVLVLLGLLTDEEVPQWRSTIDQRDEGLEFHMKSMERHRNIAAENRLPPAQQAAARQKRIEQERWDFHNETVRRAQEARKRQEREFQEAVNSQKLTVQAVCNGTRKWLIEKKHVIADAETTDIIEQLLVMMIEDESFAKRVADMLNMWKSWTENSGLRKEHYDAIHEDLEAFSYASLVLDSVRSSTVTGQGNVVSDLQECLRMWKKVRLG